MKRILTSHLALAVLVGAALPLASWAQEEASPAPGPSPNFEGAIGLQLTSSPQYQGSELRRISPKPGIYLRWGRFSVATSSNFVTRYDDEVVRGGGAELIQRDDLRVQLGLRYDPGRKTRVSPDLAQRDEVRNTLRARVSAVWQPVRDWRFSAGWSGDILGRDGGANLSRLLGPTVDSPLTLTTTQLSAGAGFAWHF